MTTAKEQFLKFNTLSGLVGECVGTITTVELRNEAFVTGKVVEVDGFMNVTLEKAEFTDPCGNRRNFDQFFVQQRLIRCVQIPTKLDIREALKKSVLPKRKQDQIELSKNRKHILKKRNEQRLQDQMNAVKKS